ncbi:DUF2332 domain-containing protein [Cellulomonas carbonis]|uniref:DUF2332 domain-containing protein n=1 Tax=Cellulomonas carbonis T26 TaxID=947969 RepID=A0A0A0BVI5_9CELL|nr:DUF2332 domain-containing protein [Cellulomonas carbonis]KGM11682.1 hypothetical protein N868_07915 [Cellulomonas carbonis T26]GGB99160.1 hypothetical protein GCM10010972_09990 [Cellulomonas carbonis]
MDPIGASPDTATWWRDFGRLEASGESPLLARWCAEVARDRQVLALVDRLPWRRRQPNLVVAAARLLGAPDEPYPAFRAWLVAHWPAVEAVALARTTQTNEAGRCATLLPVLAELDGPLALLEVGASAGLCLVPDRYAYRYTTPTRVVVLEPAVSTVPTVPTVPNVNTLPTVPRVELPCRVDDDRLVPTHVPRVVWRAGIDLSPLDVRDPDDVAWLEALVWPGADDRVRRLRAAARVVAADPPTIVRGDLLDRLVLTAAAAPRDATLVVLHTAVLAYVDAAVRDAFTAAVRDLGAVWVSNEGQRVLPAVSARLPPGVDTGGRFVLARDGVPRALTHPHGTAMSAVP